MSKSLTTLHYTGSRKIPLIVSTCRIDGKTYLELSANMENGEAAYIQLDETDVKYIMMSWKAELERIKGENMNPSDNVRVFGNGNNYNERIKLKDGYDQWGNRCVTLERNKNEISLSRNEIHGLVRLWHEIIGPLGLVYAEELGKDPDRHDKTLKEVHHMLIDMSTFIIRHIDGLPHDDSMKKVLQRIYQSVREIIVLILSRKDKPELKSEEGTEPGSPNQCSTCVYFLRTSRRLFSRFQGRGWNVYAGKHGRHAELQVS